jgi:hypothetical protein
MKRLAIILLAIFLAGCTAQAAPPKAPQTNLMVVVGTDEFKADIQQGLDLLKERAPDEYKMVMENITKVYLNKEPYNGIYPDRSYRMDKYSYAEYIILDEYKPYRIAAVLIHEGTHAQRMKKGIDKKGDPKEEEIAFNAARNFLNKINNNGSYGALDYLERSYQTWKQGK